MTAEDKPGEGQAAKGEQTPPTAAKPQEQADRSGQRIPEDEPHGPERRQFSEAYEQGRKLKVTGPTAFLRNPVVEDMHIGDRNYFYFSRDTRTLQSGSVRADVLTWVRARYAPVRGYARMVEVLRERHILVLCGSPGSGRFTTALRLLDEVAGDAISRLDCGDGLSSFPDDQLSPGRGYVTRFSRQAFLALTELGLDGLRDKLQAKPSYLVVITDHDELVSGGVRGGAGSPDLEVDILGGYGVDHSPPDTEAVLRQHLVEELRGEEVDVDALLKRFSSDPRLAAVLSPSPTPAEVARIAVALADLGRGGTDVAGVERAGARLVQHQVQKWFAELASASDEERKRALRLTAFRIALAVLNFSSYGLVNSMAEILFGKFTQRLSAGHTQKKDSLFVNDHSATLPASRAELVDGFSSSGLETIPAKMVQFSDGRLPTVLLGQMWNQHHDMRGAVLEWLQELSADPRPMVWVRAAQATGFLCSLSFHEVFTPVIAPCASSPGKENEQRRRFAAVALDHTVRDERLEDAVYSRLKHWRRHGSESEQWTAAAAFGYELGLRKIDLALEELRVLGTPSELLPVLDDSREYDRVVVSGYSVANLLAFGEVAVVLRRLVAWTRSERQSVRELAWWSIFYLIYLHGFDLHRLTRSAGRLEATRNPSRDRWPLLLELAESDPGLAETIGEVLRWGLRSRRGDSVAKHMLGTWVRTAESESGCLEALCSFLPHLVRDMNDVKRLHHMISRLRRDWCDPLDDASASALEQSLASCLPRKEAS